jgi:hypothetical protein
MPGGRPSKYNDGVIEQTRELALAGKTNDEIAAALDINRSTLTAWKLKHPEFSAALKAWKDDADDAVEQSLYAKALSGDTTACIFWLKNRRSQDWRDVKHIDSKQQVTHRYDLDSLEAERLEELERILAVAERGPGGASETITPQVH